VEVRNLVVYVPTPEHRVPTSSMCGVFQRFSVKMFVRGGHVSNECGSGRVVVDSGHSSGFYEDELAISIQVHKVVAISVHVHEDVAISVHVQDDAAISVRVNKLLV